MSFQFHNVSQESLGTRLGCFHIHLCLLSLSPASHHCTAGWGGCWEQQGRQPDQEEGHSTGPAGGLQKHLRVLYPGHMSTTWCHMLTHELCILFQWRIDYHQILYWSFSSFCFKFLDHLPVISTELLTTYMLPGLNSVLRDMETLDATKVVRRQLHILLMCCLLFTFPMFQISLQCSSSLETASQRSRSTRSRQLGMLTLYSPNCHVC